MKVRDLPFIALALSLSRTGLGGTWMENGMTFSYSLSDDGGARVSIASCGVSASVVIPSEIDGHKVTGIEATSSDCLANLASVVIPNGVTYIGDDAFRGCSSLMSITLPDSVIRLGAYAFAWCTSLTSISIPNGVTSFGSSAFERCSKLKAITILDGVTSLGASAFSECGRLTSITLPASVTTIGGGAFANCTNLMSIMIPNGVTNIGYQAFGWCYSLQSITMPDRVTFINRGLFGPKPFLACSLSTVFVKPRAGTTDVVVEIPNGVDAAKVTVVVGPDVKTVTPNGAAVRIVRGDADITDFLDIPAAVGGVVDLDAATVKAVYANEPLDTAQEAKIDLSTPTPQHLSDAQGPRLSAEGGRDAGGDGGERDRRRDRRRRPAVDAERDGEGRRERLLLDPRQQVAARQEQACRTLAFI